MYLLGVRLSGSDSQPTEGLCMSGGGRSRHEVSYSWDRGRGCGGRTKFIPAALPGDDKTLLVFYTKDLSTKRDIMTDVFAEQTLVLFPERVRNDLSRHSPDRGFDFCN